MRTASGLALGILFLVALMTDGILYAQTIYLRDAKITIAPNTTLSVGGDVDNEGTIVNNGHLKVAGPWINSGRYEPGDGQITFNSSSATVPQIIHHNGQHFNKVNISGGNKKVLLSDMTIIGEMEFNNGVIEIAGDARLIFDDDAILSGGSDSSHVNGGVYHKGSGYKLFPIGNGSKYLPVELPDVKDPLALIGVRSYEFGSASIKVPSALKSLYYGRYWQMDIASGSPGSPIVLPLKDVSWADDPENIVVVQSESMTENFISLGRSAGQATHDLARVRSDQDVSMPFIAIATTATDEEITIYNAVSGNGDNVNDFLRIEGIQNYSPNKLTVYNRWGDKVFEIDNYDNNVNVFRGRANLNGDSELISGTYFYVLDLPGRETVRGFIVVKN